MISPADFSSSYKLCRTQTASTDRAIANRTEAVEDAALVRRFNSGDESAFVEIVTRYRERMFAVAFSMLKNRADAEEIAQDTFIRAHRGLAKFRGDSSLATWLHRIALNLSRNRYWYFFRRQRHASVSFDAAFSENNRATFTDLVATDRADPAQEAATNEFSSLVTTCMAGLDAQKRQILILRNLRHRSYVEIAQDLGITVGTVKSRIARARESLRALLAAACPEFGADAQPLDWFDPVRPVNGMVKQCA